MLTRFLNTSTITAKFLLLFSMLFITACSSGSSTPQTSTEQTTDDSITTKIILHETGSQFYDNADYKNLRLSSDDTFLYALETKKIYVTQNISLFKYNMTSNAYELQGKANTDTITDNIINFELSNDGRHVYATSQNEIKIYSRNTSSGKLNLQSTIQRTEISSNFFPDIIAAPSSGTLIFISNANDNSIATFIRNQSTGSLTLSAIQKPNSDRFITKLLISPDNNNLYVIFDELIITASINNISGTLTYGQVFTSGTGSSNELTSYGQLKDAAFFSNDTLVFFANAYFRYADSTQALFKSLIITQRDSITGNLSYIKNIDLETSSVGAIFNGSVITNSSSNFSYVLFEADNPGQTSTNRLIKLKNAPLSADFSVYTTSQIDTTDTYGHIVGTIKSDGTKLILTDARNEGGDITEIDLDHTPANNNFIKKLVPYTNRIEGLSNVAHIVTSHDGKNIYAFTNSLDPTITSYQFDNSTGKLTYINTLKLRSSQFLPEMTYLSLGSSIKTDVILDSAVISPDGRHLLLLTSNKILCLQRDLSTGKLSRLTSIEAGIFSLWDTNGPNIPVSDITFFESSLPGFMAETITISPDGNYLYVAGLTSNDDTALAIISRNSVTGGLQLSGILDTSLPSGERSFFPRGPLFSKITNDGEYLYLSNQNIAALLELKLSATTGLVESISTLQDGMTDSNNRTFEGLLNVSAIRFSADDRFIYLASDDIYSGFSPNIVSLQVLERLPTTGDIQIKQVIKRSNSGITDGDLFLPNIIQGGARTIEISQDNNYIYMLTQKTRSLFEPMEKNGYSLDVYEINQTTGLVQLVQRHKSDLAGLGVSSIKTIPGNDYVIASNDLNGAIGVLTQ